MENLVLKNQKVKCTKMSKKEFDENHSSGSSKLNEGVMVEFEDGKKDWIPDFTFDKLFEQ